MINPARAQQVTFATRILAAMDAQKHRLRGNVKQPDKALAEMTKIPRDRLRSILDGSDTLITVSEFNRIARALPALLVYRDEVIPPSPSPAPPTAPDAIEAFATKTGLFPARVSALLDGAPLTPSEVRRTAPFVVAAPLPGALHAVTLTPKPRAPGDKFVHFNVAITPPPAPPPAPEPPMPAPLALVPPIPPPPPPAPAPRPPTPQLRPKTFGQWLRAFREEAGATQEHVASILEVDGTTVSNWETDATLPTRQNHMNLLQLFPGLTGAPRPGGGRARPALPGVRPARPPTPPVAAEPAVDPRALVRYGMTVSRALAAHDAATARAVIDLIVNGLAQGLPVDLLLATVRGAFEE